MSKEVTASCDDISPIVSYVFLGNFRAASNLAVLQENQIKRVLSVLTMREVIPANCRLEGVEYKHIVKTDQPNEDLLLSLPECLEFLDSSVAAKQNVLVHCQMGASRSATVVIAYVMRINSWPVNQALQFVKSHRPIVNPNSGFHLQLRLFEKMACRLNPSNAEFRMYFLNVIVFRNYPEQFHTNLAEYLRRLEELERQETRENSKLAINAAYRCVKCAKTVFCNLNVFTAVVDNTHNEPTKDKECNSYLIEPAIWMTSTSTGANIFASFPQNSSGIIPCPHCNFTIGKFTFQPFVTQLCSCPTHKGISSCLKLAVSKDAVTKKVIGKKSFFAKLLGK